MNEIIIGDPTPFLESSLVEGERESTAHIKIIKPGWGSSGYYKADVLRRDGPRVFTEGTQMLWDHPTSSEARERPEGSLNNLAAKLTENARWLDDGPSGPGLYARAKVFGQYKEALKDLAPHIGVSIRASGSRIDGEAEGRRGPVIESLESCASVDFVTKAGAGGRIVNLFEAAGRGEPQPQGEVMDKKEIEALIEAATKPLIESNTQLKTTLEQTRVENARMREAVMAGQARTIVQEQLRTVSLPDITKARLVESLAPKFPVKDGAIDLDAFKALITEAAKAEGEYIASLGGNPVRGVGAPRQQADDKTDWKAKLQESFRALGMSDKEAATAAVGRKQ